MINKTMAEMAPQNWVGVTSVQGGGFLRIHYVFTEEADVDVVKYYRKINQGRTTQINGVVGMMNAEINPVETNWELVRVLHEGNWVCSIYRVTDTEMKKLMEKLMGDDSMAETPQAKQFETEAKHSMPPPTGTFLK